MRTILAHEGEVAASTARIYARDLKYFWAWARAARSLAPTYPVPPDCLRTFVAMHLAGLDVCVLRRLRQKGFQVDSRPLSPRSLRRKLASLSVEHDRRGTSNPCRDSRITFLLRRAQRRFPGRVQRPITGDVLSALTGECGRDLRGVRDRALLLVGFSGGGRRRSELAELAVSDLQAVPGGYMASLSRHKTVSFTGEPLTFPILGEAARALNRWLCQAYIREGAVFRGIRSDNTLNAAMNARTVNVVIKRLARRAGLDATQFGAHSLRSGFVTEAARQQIPLPEAMAVSGHRSIAIAWRYYRAGSLIQNRAAHLKRARRSGSDRRVLPRANLKRLKSGTDGA